MSLCGVIGVAGICVGSGVTEITCEEHIIFLFHPGSQSFSPRRPEIICFTLETAAQARYNSGHLSSQIQGRQKGSVECHNPSLKKT
jgi:hypothetical protein